ncbi:MAG: S41 family peptidase [Chitinophagaceae bacterium]|jgi:hypothetical protein|nr:S41 family peptidase [Chitinophagaceae bacterium]
MRIFSILFFLITLQGCTFFEKKDIVTATISKDKLRDDFLLLENIISQAHAGAYFYNSEFKLNHLFDSVYNTIDTALTVIQFYNKVDYIIDKLGCIHSSTDLPDDLMDTLVNRKLFFPIPLITTNKKLYVNSDNYSIPLGSEILSFNNESPQQIISKLKTYYHTDGNSDNIKTDAIDNYFAFNYFLAYSKSDSFSLIYKDGETGVIESKIILPEKLNTIYQNEYNNKHYFITDDAKYDLEMMNSIKTAVLTIRTFHFETGSKESAYNNFIQNSFQLLKLSGTKNLIIDCRNNLGGYYSSTYRLLSYLSNQKLQEFDSAIKRFDKIPFKQFVCKDDAAKVSEEDSSDYLYTQIRKGIYALQNAEIKSWEPNALTFKGKVFLLINSKVASAASTFAAILKDKTNTVLIGEETGGNYSAHNSYIFNYVLPNSQLKVGVPTMRYYQPVQNKQSKRGVLPHKYITITLDDIKSLNDRSLNYVLDSLIKK